MTNLLSRLIPLKKKCEHVGCNEEPEIYIESYVHKSHAHYCRTHLDEIIIDYVTRDLKRTIQ